ncbi:hypothetical protein [Nocardia brasiliensis]|uniref:hypothetical protein n=1 Tax=Nocardia brasiliensis TaxID=37326 RepID=UPI00189458E9|nr:hypothetical protein [Nocardia brasiliensis]MBF6547173.1 hypothetical protein [Nocardia brasiliensis]
MDESVDQGIKDAALRFLQGTTSAADFWGEFNAAVQAVADDRPLRGLEVDLFDVLEQWEATIFELRPDVVDKMRRIARDAAAS